MFSKLFEILPDAEYLLSLEPEELAGPLLVSLIDDINSNRRSDNTVTPDIIAYDNMKREIEEGGSRRNPNLNYTYEHREKTLFALMEAWQFLLSNGYIALSPKNLARLNARGSASTYFITRRGKKVKTLEDYEAYRKADLLRKHQLHDIIAEKVWSIFAQGSYDTAVMEAFKQVEIAVREAGGYNKEDIGANLMGKAFNENTGSLTDPNQHPDEQKARMLLFRGAIGAYKNPSSHREVEFTPEEAAEIIIIASHLLRIIDPCEKLDTDLST